MPIWRSSCRAITSDSPPGRPAIFDAHCESSISVPIFVPSLSSMSEFMVESRICLSSCCVNIVSNCLAASRTALFGSLSALTRRFSRPPARFSDCVGAPQSFLARAADAATRVARGSRM